ncbi:MAG: ftsZ [Chloroflexi bacterium]|nr:ftsZ [Chloroflexota bacterium]
MIGQMDGAARIVVLGIGGGGCNAVDRMIAAGLGGVEFVAVNTDQQALTRSDAPRRIRLGEKLTRGLGAGGNPIVGAKAAEETADELFDVCRGADMVFIAAGMGGGTGTGGSRVVAQIAQEVGALTVGVVTKPFAFEGSRRRRTAEEGISALQAQLHTLIVIPNDRVLQVIDKRTTVQQAFAVADDVLRQGIQGISELITRPGLINLDFADVKSVMSESGIALMAIGSAAGENRAVEAAQAAMASPLLDLSMQGARGVLFNITSGPDLSLADVNRAADVIRAAADPDANIIFGTVIDESLTDEVRITVIATGFDASASGVSTRSTGSFRGFQFPESSEPAPPAYGSPTAEEPYDALRRFGQRPTGLDDPLPPGPDWTRGQTRR